MIKLIAVDMDGTFLNDMKDYNRQRFDMLFDMMKT
ncbi:HAD superfamily hydrolase [Erysipelothrix aquatica]